MSDRFLLYNLQTDKALTVSDERISDRRIVIAKSVIDERSWWEIEQYPGGNAFLFINIATKRQLFVSRQDEMNGDWLIEAATNGSYFRLLHSIAGSVTIGSNDPRGEIFVAGDKVAGEHVAELREGIEADRSAFVLLRRTGPSIDPSLIFNGATGQTWFHSNDLVENRNAVEAQPINNARHVRAIEERKFFQMKPLDDGLFRILATGTNQWLTIADFTVVGVTDATVSAPFSIDAGPDFGLSVLRTDHGQAGQTAFVSDEKLGGDEVVRVTPGSYPAERAGVVFLQPWVPELG